MRRARSSRGRIISSPSAKADQPGSGGNLSGDEFPGRWIANYPADQTHVRHRLADGPVARAGQLRVRLGACTASSTSSPMPPAAIRSSPTRNARRPDEMPAAPAAPAERRRRLQRRAHAERPQVRRRKSRLGQKEVCRRARAPASRFTSAIAAISPRSRRSPSRKKASSRSIAW